MSVVKTYQIEKDVVYATGKLNRVTTDKLRTREIVRITHISGTFENCKTDEYVELGYWNGHAYVPLTRGKPDETGREIHWNGNIWLREEQYIYAYFAGVAAGEKMKLRTEGRWE